MPPRLRSEYGILPARQKLKRTYVLKQYISLLRYRYQYRFNGAGGDEGTRFLDHLNEVDLTHHRILVSRHMCRAEIRVTPVRACVRFRRTMSDSAGSSRVPDSSYEI